MVKLRLIGIGTAQSGFGFSTSRVKHHFFPLDPFACSSSSSGGVDDDAGDGQGHHGPVLLMTQTLSCRNLPFVH